MSHKNQNDNISKKNTSKNPCDLQQGKYSSEIMTMEETFLNDTLDFIQIANFLSKRDS